MGQLNCDKVHIRLDVDQCWSYWNTLSNTTVKFVSNWSLGTRLIIQNVICGKVDKMMQVHPWMLDFNCCRYISYLVLCYYYTIYMVAVLSNNEQIKYGLLSSVSSPCYTARWAGRICLTGNDSSHSQSTKRCSGNPPGWHQGLGMSRKGADVSTRPNGHRMQHNISVLFWFIFIIS